MVYAAGTSVRKGRAEAIEAVARIASLIEPTLGPNGTDVLITTPFGEIYTTNDGATVMREVPITHPAARIAADIALTQERAAGDGTTSTVVLASKLLTELEPLIDTIGIREVLKGLDRAERAIERIIEENERDLTEKDLVSIVTTALSGKGGEPHAQLIAQLIIEAVPSADAHVSMLERVGEPMKKSRSVEGIIIDHLPVRDDMPQKIENPKLMLISGALEPAQPTGVSIGSANEAQRFFEHEDEEAARIASRIVRSGARVVITRKGVDDRIAHLLAHEKIMVVRRVPLETLETIARASEARIIPAPDERGEGLGRARRVFVEGDETIIEGFAHPASTLILCGSTQHVAAELARAAHDAYGVIKAARSHPRGVGGALLIETLSSCIEGSDVEKAVASAFDRLAQSISTTLPEPGKGIDVRDMTVIDPWKRGIIEPVDVKRGVVSAAFEITRTILRIETIVSLPDPRRN